MACSFSALLRTILLVVLGLLGSLGIAEGQTPEWCKKLPRPEYKQVTRVPTQDDWFEVYRVRPDVFAIYEPHQSEEAVFYLILGIKKALLFDTGMGIGDLRALVQQLTKLPVSVLNSHTHNDHVGSNWQFQDIYGMDTEFTRANARGSRKDAQAEIAPDEVCGTLPPGFDAAAYSTKPWKITHVLHDGDTIDLGGRKLKVIATPGHTPDSIALLDAANGLLWTGDTYYPGTIWIYRPETNLDAFENSLERLVRIVHAEHVRMLLPAHNLPIADPAALEGELNAFRKVRSGRLKPTSIQNGRAIYNFGKYSFLMKSR